MDKKRSNSGSYTKQERRRKKGLRNDQEDPLPSFSVKNIMVEGGQKPGSKKVTVFVWKL